MSPFSLGDSWWDSAQWPVSHAVVSLPASELGCGPGLGLGQPEDCLLIMLLTRAATIWAKETMGLLDL